MQQIRIVFVLLCISVLQGCLSPAAYRQLALEEITISQLQDAYRRGEYTIAEVTFAYLERIQSLDDSGPQLNAMISLNPDALMLARELDMELQSGVSRGPLHGIPVVLKDNIDTGDDMPTTAGARVLAASYAPDDAFIVSRLRSAGAVILGKANLSEWANFHSNLSSSGWSGVGGQTRNPYDISRNPCGSSAGSAVAVSANFAVLAIGTETNGSIVCPASANGVVGIKPTVGLLSRDGIIPISSTQDTAGPLSRTVTDAAIALGVLAGSDPDDESTLVSGRYLPADYSDYLDPNALQGRRIGFWTGPLGSHFRVDELMLQAVSLLESRGAEIIEIDTIESVPTSADSFQVLLYEFKHGINRYLESLGDNAPVRSLAEIIDHTFSDPVEMQYFDHDLLVAANRKGSLNSEEYLLALGRLRINARDNAIDRVMDEYRLDAIVGPSGGPAWKTDLTNGDNFSVSSSSPAARAGYPNITVPMGNIDGLPVGISFFGRAWSEPLLIGFAFDFEQASRARRIPLMQDSSSAPGR